VINHFDLFGFRQVYLFQKGKAYTNLIFKKRFFYKFVRHPLCRFIIAFWATPKMTLGHLVFAFSDHAYILIRDSARRARFDQQFTVMRTGIPARVSMLIPLPKSKQTPERYRQRKQRETGGYHKSYV